MVPGIKRGSLLVTHHGAFRSSKGCSRHCRSGQELRTMLVQSGVGSIINAPTAADDVELDRASCEISNAPVSIPGPERKIHMNLGLRSILTTVAICGFFMTTTVIGRAQTVGQGSCIGACKGEVVGILVGIGAGGASLGIDA